MICVIILNVIRTCLAKCLLKIDSTLLLIHFHVISYFCFWYKHFKPTWGHMGNTRYGSLLLLILSSNQPGMSPQQATTPCTSQSDKLPPLIGVCVIGLPCGPIAQWSRVLTRSARGPGFDSHSGQVFLPPLLYLVAQCGSRRFRHGAKQI